MKRTDPRLCVCGHAASKHVATHAVPCLVCTCPNFELAGSNDPPKPPDYVYDHTCLCVACVVRNKVPT